jgi:hypothetical protein
LFEEKRMRLSSEENDAPPIASVLRNCSIVYCFDGLTRVAGPAVCATADASANPRIATTEQILYANVFIRLSPGRLRGRCLVPPVCRRRASIILPNGTTGAPA